MVKKYNNHYKNLEWVTHKENRAHALETSLTTDNVSVTAKNIKTNERIIFLSYGQVISYFNLYLKQLPIVIYNSKKRPYLNEWVFEIDASRINQAVKHNRIQVKAKNYQSGEIFFAESAFELSFKIGVLQTTIGKTIERFKFKRERLINGHVIRHLLDKRPWPEFSAEYVQSHLKKIS
jgi:hypothetical protein